MTHIINPYRFVRQTPSLRSGNSGNDTDDTYVVTPTITPIEGTLGFIALGGNQSRSVVTPPAGWTAVPESGYSITNGTNHIYYKLMTASEPANYTFVLSGALGGSWRFLEFLNVDVTTLILNSGGSSGGTVTTFSPVTSYNITVPSIAITTFNITGATGAWSADNSFTNIGGSGEFDSAYKLYAGAASGEDVNWSTGGSAVQVSSRIIAFRGKPMN